MKVNQLVNVTGYNIGVISRVLKKSVEVRFDENTYIKVKPERIRYVDDSATTTIPWSEFIRKSLTHEWDSYKGKIILGNEVKEWVGFGWVTRRIVNDTDLIYWPRVVEDDEHERRMLNKKFGL